MNFKKMSMYIFLKIINLNEKGTAKSDWCLLVQESGQPPFSDCPLLSEL